MRTIRLRLLLIAMVDPEPNSMLVARTSWYRSVWRRGSGDKEAGDIRGNERSTFNKTRDDNE
jgi:hypothetical protein